VPIASAQQYLKGKLDGLPMPGGAPNLACYVTPPDPNVESDIPTAYVWPSNGREARDPDFAGSMSRNAGPGTPSGFKTIEHQLDIWVIWFGSDDDDDADTLFPGMVDAIMFALRTDTPNPDEYLTDPWTGQQTQLANVGETIQYQVTVNSVADQRYLRYDAMLTLPLIEVIQA